MTRLSPHFTLEELTVSQEAARSGIDNDPPLTLMPNLKRLAEGLELVRTVLNANPLHVSSAYRSEELERVICASAYKAWCKTRLLQETEKSWKAYFRTKQHPSGNAADFTSPGFGPPARIVHAIYSSPIVYDQLILEYDAWVHISFSDNPRKQALIIDRKGSRSYP